MTICIAMEFVAKWKLLTAKKEHNTKRINGNDSLGDPGANEKH